MPTRVKTCSQRMGPTQAHPQKVSLDPTMEHTQASGPVCGGFLSLACTPPPLSSQVRPAKVEGHPHNHLGPSPQPLRARNFRERSPSTPPASKTCCQILGPTCFQKGQLDSATTSPILVFLWPHLPTGLSCFPPCKGHATSSSSKTQQWISTAWAVAHPTRPLAKLPGCTRT